MPPIPRLPEPLLHGPFTPETAATYGVSERMLRGRQWKRIHPRVWVHRDHIMTHRDDIHAATLTMPERARLSHVSRIQQLGLDIGPRAPIHFTVSGDLHIATAGVFLHRTEVLPPSDEIGVSPASAFLQFCASARLLDAVVAGDWLLSEAHMSLLGLKELARRDTWRPGARQTLQVAEHLDGRSRSPKESEVRMLLRFAGLPAMEVNASVHHGAARIAIVDLLLDDWRLVLEYEGRQHALDTGQFQRDITRYARLREAGYEYVQITQRMLDQPRAMVMHVDKVLRRRGYDGVRPDFGDRWQSLFKPIPLRSARGAVGQRRIPAFDPSLTHRSDAG